MLRVSQLSCGYGNVIAVNKLSFTVRPGEIFGLIGANGAGKSATILALAGLIDVIGGQVELEGQDITHLPTHQRVNAGIALVPEGRRVFADLTVIENLIVGATRMDKPRLDAGCERVFATFPRLAERRDQLAGLLSGGEQQMLAIARALMAEPSVLLIDELSLGLMPIVVDECYRVLEALRKEQLAIVLVEQSTERVQQVASQVSVLETGRVVWQGTGEQAARDSSIVEAYLGLK